MKILPSAVRNTDQKHTTRADQLQIPAACVRTVLLPTHSRMKTGLGQVISPYLAVMMCSAIKIQYGASAELLPRIISLNIYREVGRIYSMAPMHWVSGSLFLISAGLIMILKTGISLQLISAVMETLHLPLGRNTEISAAYLPDGSFLMKASSRLHLFQA